MSWILYGAYGFSGKLILEELRRRQLPMPILAGRKRADLEDLAASYGAQYRAFDLKSLRAVCREIRGQALVLNCAGPFSRTFKPIVEACLHEGVHYLDITGEVHVFERIYERDFRAQAAGITLLPGVGFDVVPTDCLAATLHGKLEDATHLELAFATKGKMSHGTLLTMLENLPKGGLIRRKGSVTYSSPGRIVRDIEFVKGQPQRAMAIPWGDVASAFRTTEIPNIVVYTAVPPSGVWAAKSLNVIRPVLGSKMAQKLATKFVDRFVQGPNAERREATSCYIWGEVRNRQGDVWRANVQTCDGYELTARSAVESVQRVLRKEAPTGALTPVLAFGAKFLSEIDPNASIVCEKIS